MGVIGFSLLAVITACAIGALKAAPPAKHLCAVGLVIAIVFLFIRQLNGGAEDGVVLDRGFEETAGRRIARAILNDAAGGKVVVAVYNIPHANENWRRQAKAYWNGMSDELKDTDVKVVACDETFAEEAYAWLTGNQAGTDDLLAVMRRAAASVPEAQVFVTFLGLPPQASARDLAGLPTLYSLESSPSDLVSALLRTGVLRGVVTFRDDADWGATPNADQRWEDLFDQRYEFIESPAG